MAVREKLPDGTTRISGSGTAAWPVDAVYISFSSANPGTIFGGVWTAIGTGRMLVGVDPSEPLWDAVGETGGSKTHTITTAELPAHGHPIDHNHAATTTAVDGAHNHATPRRAVAGGTVGHAIGGGAAEADGSTNNDGGHDHAVDIPPYVGSSGSTGGGAAGNFLPPYIAVYMWRRTS